mgnify:CR=1 FL=1|jgi:predicted nucleic acid-binding protein
MNIVVDANILFSALIRDSMTRRLILEYDEQFLFPDYVFFEMEKHKKVLLKKSKMSENDFDDFLRLMLQKISVVPNEILRPYCKEAYEIIKDIDPDDEMFIACALAYKNCVLWSNDKALKKQSRVKVLNTSEIKILFETKIVN